MKTYKDNFNVAIIGLTRGYPDNKSQYNDLLLRNKKIYENINSKQSKPYKLILFHEGNISLSDQDYIQNNSPENLQFVDISSLFEKYKYTDGYKIMCKFQMFYLWDYVKEFDYVIRIDEDVFIEKFDVSTINKMNKKNIDFYFSKLSFESHVPTNQTLPFYIKNYYNLNNINFYNHLFPYTNFYISKTNIWKIPKINQLLKDIAESSEQIEFRWGDLPVIGCILNLENLKYRRLKTLSYMHDSHNLFVESNILTPILERINLKRVRYRFPKLYSFLKKSIKKLKIV